MLHCNAATRLLPRRVVWQDRLPSRAEKTSRSKQTEEWRAGGKGKKTIAPASAFLSLSLSLSLSAPDKCCLVRKASTGNAGRPLSSGVNRPASQRQGKTNQGQNSASPRRTNITTTKAQRYVLLWTGKPPSKEPSPKKSRRIPCSICIPHDC